MEYEYLSMAEVLH